jgi:hydroxyacylglutathione hydrolase
MIFDLFTSGPFETNTYLLACSETQRGVVIDVPFKSSEWILQRVEELSLKIEAILFTHSHWDHIAEASLLKEKWNVPIHIHPDDAGNLEDPGSDGLPLFFPIQKVKADGFLFDGQILNIGSLSIRVIHTPGHTPGGVCFYLPKEKILISGDTLFHGTIGNLNFPTACPARMWDSLKKLAALPPDTKVYPGHGESTTIGAEKWIVHAEDRF